MMRTGLLFFILIFSFLNIIAQTPELLQQKLPSVVLSDLEGNKVDLSQLTAEGKTIVLSFWATWCVPCKKELTNIMEVYDEWQENYNMELIAISTDDSRNTSKVKPTVDGQGWDYRVLLDPNGELKRALGFQIIPYTVVANSDGYIVYQHTGYVEGDEFELEEKLKELVEN